jgi:hypothetical protein
LALYSLPRNHIPSSSSQQLTIVHRPRSQSKSRALERWPTLLKITSEAGCWIDRTTGRLVHRSRGS